MFLPLPTKIMAALYSLAITIKISLWLLQVCVNWPPVLIWGSRTPSRTTTQQTQRDRPGCSPELWHSALLITEQGQSFKLKHKGGAKRYACCEFLFSKGIPVNIRWTFAVQTSQRVALGQSCCCCSAKHICFLFMSSNYLEYCVLGVVPIKSEQNKWQRTCSNRQTFQISVPVTCTAVLLLGAAKYF